MLILKKINNNVALACSDAGEEIVVFGKGVGFPAMPYELEDESIIQRVFVSGGDNSSEALTTVSDEVLLAASDIVDVAKATLDCKLAPSLPFVLADHLQFAVERDADGIVLTNPLAHEIAYVYPREQELGLRGIEAVRKHTGVQLPESEATSIALHLVNAEVNGMGSSQDMDLVLKSAVALEQITQIVESHLGVTLDHASYAYVRFVAHLRFLIRRLMKDSCKPTENSSLFRQAARDFPEAYQCAAAIDNYLKQSNNWACSDEEMLYLMMHINRLKQS